MDVYQFLTIANSTALAILPLAFFRRQKLDEIKYKELMELNVKTHDITKRADKTLATQNNIDRKDYDRLDYLISRYRKHSLKLSNLIEEYKSLWDVATKKSVARRKDDKKMSEGWVTKTKKSLLSKSSEIRDLADKLLK